MKINFYLKILLSTLCISISNYSFADYTINVSTLDNTKINRKNVYFDVTNPPYSCPSSSDFPPGCQLVFNSGSLSDVFYFIDPSGKKRFKFYLADSGNWSLIPYFGDHFKDLNSYFMIPTIGQIQLHGMFPMIYLYSNAAGVYIKDQDDKIIELATWN